MEIENDNPNIFIDFIIQSGSFVDHSRDEMQKVADVSDCLFHVDMVQQVLMKD